MQDTIVTIDPRPLLPGGCGFIEIPFPDGLTQPFANEFDAWLEHYPNVEDRCQLQELVAGEPDLGYIRRRGERVEDHRKDHKHVFHYNPGFADRWWEKVTPADRRLFAAGKELYSAAHQAARNVLQAMALYDSSYAILLERFDEATVRPRPRSDHVLRGLVYDDELVEEKQLAAQLHCDRSLLSVSKEGNGGVFYSERKGCYFRLLPRPGHAIVFWGVKAAILTKGTLQPLLHGSLRAPGETRRAWPFFGHGVTSVPVDDWREVIDHPERFYE